jgi:hypothetical protein
MVKIPLAAYKSNNPLMDLTKNKRYTSGKEC